MIKLNVTIDLGVDGGYEWKESYEINELQGTLDKKVERRRAKSRWELVATDYVTIAQLNKRIAEIRKLHPKVKGLMKPI